MTLSTRSKNLIKKMGFDPSDKNGIRQSIDKHPSAWLRVPMCGRMTCHEVAEYAGAGNHFRPFTKPMKLSRGQARQLLDDAIFSAEKAMAAYPQPNYVCAKLGEEAGEVIRAYIHHSEGRATREELRAECVQLIGLVLRLLSEGDQTIDEVAPDLSKGKRT